LTLNFYKKKTIKSHWQILIRFHTSVSHIERFNFLGHPLCDENDVLKT